MANRKFHVELTVTKWVEVNIGDAETYEDDELGDEVETRALEDFWSSDRTWGDDYEYVTIKEVSDAKESA